MTIKQYVNLPGVTTNQGTSVGLKVTPNPIANVAPGDRVEWWIDPVPGHANTDIAFLSVAQRAKLAQPENTGHTVAGSYLFENTLTVAPVGGDQYVVKTSRKGNRAQFLALETIETWRKLYYTIYYMGPESLRVFNALEPDYKAAFATSYIEFVRLGTVATLTVMASARVESAGGFPFMNGGPGAILSLKVGGAPATAGTLTNKPHHLAFLVCPNPFSTRRQARGPFVISAATGTTTLRFDVYDDPAGPLNWLPVARATWTGVGAVDVRANFTLNSHAPWNSRVSWDLRPVPGLTNWLATAGHNYTLNFTVVEREAFTGYSVGNFVVVGVTGPGRSDKAVKGTLVHETGHGCGQAVRSEPQYTLAGAATTILSNPMYYQGTTTPPTPAQDFGGQGPHCHTNATLVPSTPPRPPTGSGNIWVWPPGAAAPVPLANGLCTMYHAADPTNRNDGVFCPSCEPRLRRVNLDTASMTGNPRNWDYIG